MSHTVARGGTRGWRLPTDWWDVIFNTLLITGLGVLIGTQYMEPDKRVLQVAAAVVLLGVAWRLDTVTGLGVLVLMLPFPRGTVFGNTNMAMILLLLVIWLLRFSTGTAPKPRATPLDAPILALVVAYVVSFYNVDPRFLDYAFGNMLLFLSCLGFYALVVNNVRNTRDLERLHNFMAISTAIIFLVSLFELAFPGRPFIAGWIEFQGQITEGTNVHALRIGGPFFDYELLSDFCALQLVFLVFLFTRARSIGRRTTLIGLILLTLVVMIATVTRGAVVALACGIAYLLFLTRRHLRLIPMIIFGGGGALAVTAMTLAVIQVTHVANLFERFSETTFVNGMPDSRVIAWTGGLERLMVHPLIGWGPFYSNEHGLKMWYWPHNLYLYVANCIGLIGLAVFLWLLWRIWHTVKPETDSLNDPSYARAYVLIARVQLVVFLIDQTKIEYLRNQVYQFQIWIIFASMIAASMVAAREAAAARKPVPA